MTRTPRQFASRALIAAQRQGVILDFEVRRGGRATVYLKRGGKMYTTSTLDTLALLKREGFDPNAELPPELPLRRVSAGIYETLGGQHRLMWTGGWGDRENQKRWEHARPDNYGSWVISGEVFERTLRQARMRLAALMALDDKP